MSEIHERCERLSGAGVVAELKASGALDGLFARIDAGEIELTGDGGMISVLIREALERGLQAEMTSHLGYEAGDRAGKAVTSKPVNARNGSHKWSRWIQDPSAEQGHRTASIPAMNWDFRLPRTFGD